MATNDSSSDSLMRRPLLLRTMFDVLRESDEPHPAWAVHEEVARRVDPTPEEAKRYEQSGQPRYKTFLGRASSWAHRVGWLVKQDGQWTLTDAGAKVVDRIYDDAELYRELNRSYRQAGKLIALLDLVEAGSWTAASDLASAANLSTERVTELLAASRLPNQHRVLAEGGSLDVHATAGETMRERLVGEGVEFDAAGRAAPTQRVTGEELRQALADEDVDPSPTSRRAWLVRGSSVEGHNMVPSWLAGGWVSLPATTLRPLEPPVDRDKLKQIVDEDYGHKSYAVRRGKVDEFDAFLHKMRVGDLVATTAGGKLYVGEIAGPPTFTDSEHGRSNLRREVTWGNADAPVTYTELAAPLPAKLASQSDVVDLTDALTVLDDLIDRKPLPPQRPLTLPPADDELAAALHFGKEWLQEVIELLRDRKQIIFYGPPGTGKTYVAQKLADHLTDSQASTLVQFHPSYSYEDFFEGFRPMPADDGTMRFELRPGPLRRIVDAAREDRSTPYILIIDEINRANLAKVFGELYFLLEYRDRAINLLYSTEDAEFSLPDNVFFIGTMNTSDRSIALVDAAMRRRFAFVQLHPAEPPVRGLLDRWLQERGYGEEPARLLEELNARIDDPDFAIGPSYFMRPEVHREGGLERIWRTEILPLLEEHHYGEGVDVAGAYGLDRLRAAITTDRAATESAAADQGSSPPDDADTAAESGGERGGT